MIDRTGSAEPVVTPENVFALEPDPEAEPDIDRQVAAVRRVMPLPTARERRLALRLRASELVGLMEATDVADPETAAARDDLRDRAGDPRPISRDHRRRGARPGARSADLPDARARRRRRREPPPGRAAAADPQLLVAQHVRQVPAPVRVRLRLPDAAARGARRGVHVRDAPRTRRSRRSRRSAASGSRAGTRRPPARTSSASSARAGPRPASATRPPRRATSGASRPCSTTSGTARSAASARRCYEELDFELTLEPDDGSAPVVITGSDRPDRPPAVGRHRGHRLQDRPRLGPEGRRREPPAVDLRAGLPRRAGPRHAGTGDAVLHGVGAAAVHDPDGRAAGPRAGGRAGAGVADAGRGVRGDAVGRCVPVLRLAGDVSGAGVMPAQVRCYRS